MSTHDKVLVLIETAERTFRGYVHKPRLQDDFRLSDHLNAYDKQFIALSDVTINERGQAYRAGDKHAFVAVSVASITYVTPIEDQGL